MLPDTHNEWEKQWKELHEHKKVLSYNWEIAFIASLLATQKVALYKEWAREIADEVDDMTYAIQMEEGGNKSYLQCRNEAYDRTY